MLYNNIIVRIIIYVLGSIINLYFIFIFLLKRKVNKKILVRTK